MTEELDCGKRKRRKGYAIGESSHRKKPVARTAARRLAYDRAKDSVAVTAAKFSCPEECLTMELTVRLGRPEDDECVEGPIPAGGGGIKHGWTCTATCFWSVVIRCTKDVIPPATQPMVPQELECEEGEEATASGRELCMASNADESVSKEEAVAGALAEAWNAATGQIDSVTCDNDCPNKKVTILLGPPVDTNCDPPDQNGNINCISYAEWAVTVKCY